MAGPVLHRRPDRCLCSVRSVSRLLPLLPDLASLKTRGRQPPVQHLRALVLEWSAAGPLFLREWRVLRALGQALWQARVMAMAWGWCHHSHAAMPQIACPSRDQPQAQPQGLETGWRRAFQSGAWHDTSFDLPCVMQGAGQLPWQLQENPFLIAKGKRHPPALPKSAGGSCAGWTAPPIR